MRTLYMYTHMAYGCTLPTSIEIRTHMPNSCNNQENGSMHICTSTVSCIVIHLQYM